MMNDTVTDSLEDRSKEEGSKERSKEAVVIGPKEPPKERPRQKGSKETSKEGIATGSLETVVTGSKGWSMEAPKEGLKERPKQGVSKEKTDSFPTRPIPSTTLLTLGDIIPEPGGSNQSVVSPKESGYTGRDSVSNQKVQNSSSGPLPVSKHTSRNSILSSAVSMIASASRTGSSASFIAKIGSFTKTIKQKLGVRIAEEEEVHLFRQESFAQRKISAWNEGVIPGTGSHNLDAHTEAMLRGGVGLRGMISGGGGLGSMGTVGLGNMGSSGVGLGSMGSSGGGLDSPFGPGGKANRKKRKSSGKKNPTNSKKDPSLTIKTFASISSLGASVVRKSGTRRIFDRIFHRIPWFQQLSTTSAISELVSTAKNTTPESRAIEEERKARKRTENSVAYNSIFTVDGPIQNLVIRFNSTFNRTVSFILVVSSLWTLSYTPYLIAFSYRVEMSMVWVLVNVCVDIFYLFGLVMRKFTTVCDLTYGKEWCSREQIWSYTIRDPMFYLDCLSLIPLIIQFAPPYIVQFGEWGTHGDHTTTTTTPTLYNASTTSSSTTIISTDSTDISATNTSVFPNKILQLLTLLRGHRLIKIPLSHLEAEYNIAVHISRLFLWVFLLCHILGCLWFLVLEESGTTEFHVNIDDDVKTPTDKLGWYTFALRDGVYILTGRVRPAFSQTEMLLLALIGPMGSFFFAIISANCTVLLSRLDAVARRHHEQMCFIRSAMQSLNLPSDLKIRIEKYHLFLAIHHNLNAYNSLFQGLSVQLFTELKANIYDRLFRDAPFFQNAPDDFINSIVLALEETTFSPGESVIIQGELGNEMYWILRGRCDVLDATGARVVATLAENNFFGEVALLVQVPRLCTVRAATYSLLAQITRERFLPIIDEFPGQKKYFVERIRSYHLQRDPSKNRDDEKRDREDDGDRVKDLPTTSETLGITKIDYMDGEKQNIADPSATSTCGLNTGMVDMSDNDLHTGLNTQMNSTLGTWYHDDFGGNLGPVSSNKKNIQRKASFQRRASFAGGIPAPGIDTDTTWKTAKLAEGMNANGIISGVHNTKPAEDVVEAVGVGGATEGNSLEVTVVPEDSILGSARSISASQFEEGEDVKSQQVSRTSDADEATDSRTTTGCVSVGGFSMRPGEDGFESIAGSTGTRRWSRISAGITSNSGFVNKRWSVTTSEHGRNRTQIDDDLESEVFRLQKEAFLSKQQKKTVNPIQETMHKLQESRRSSNKSNLVEKLLPSEPKGGNAVAPPRPSQAHGAGPLLHGSSNVTATATTTNANSIAAVGMKNGVNRIIEGNRLRKSLTSNAIGIDIARLDAEQQQNSGGSGSQELGTSFASPPGTGPSGSASGRKDPARVLRRASTTSNAQHLSLNSMFPGNTPGSTGAPPIVRGPPPMTAPGGGLAGKGLGGGLGGGMNNETRLLRQLMEPLKHMLQEEMGTLREMVEDLGIQQDSLEMQLRSDQMRFNYQVGLLNSNQNQGGNQTGFLNPNANQTVQITQSHTLDAMAGNRTEEEIAARERTKVAMKERRSLR